MFADAAKSLLQAIGKATTARGTFTQAEMAGAAEALRQAVKAAEPAPVDADDVSDDMGGTKKPPVVVFSQRAWPLIDMLDRTCKGGAKANIIWEAASDF